MGIFIKQGFKGTIAIYIGTIIGAVNLLWIFPTFLQPQELGLIRVLLEMGMLFALLAQFGSASIADKYFPFFNDEQKKHHGFLFFLLLYSTIGFLIIGLGYLFSYDWWVSFYIDKSPLLTDYLIYVFPLTLFGMYLIVFESYARIHMRIVIPTIIREVFLKVAMGLFVVLYYYQLISLQLLIGLLVLSYLIGVIVIMIYIKKLKTLFLRIGEFKKKKYLVKEMVVFGSFIFIGGLSGVIASRLDIMMVSSFSGLNAAGIYSIAFYLAAMIEIPRRPISSMSGPLLGNFWKTGEINKVSEIYKKTALNQLIIGMVLFLLIWCNVDFILDLMPKSDIYREGKYVILFVAIAKLVDMGTGVNGEIIVTSPIYKANFFLSVFSAINIILLNYFLIPLLGINGAAISIMINLVLSNIVRIIILQKKYQMHPFSKSLLYVSLIGILVYGVLLLVPNFQAKGLIYNIMNIGINSFVICLCCFGLVYFFKLSEDFNRIASKIIKV